LQVLTLMNFGGNVIEAAKLFQKSIAEMVERMTAFNILSVNIEVRGLK
jgi:uncharacterized alkaline shock family protein YloU